MNTKSVSKFVLLSLIGVFLFFVPVQNSKVPVVLITDTIKALLGPALGLVVVISCTLLVPGADWRPGLSYQGAGTVLQR